MSNVFGGRVTGTQAVLGGSIQFPEQIRGPQGEPGFSPTIDVKEDTADTYILTITDVDGSYDTPNLKGSGGSGGGSGEDGVTFIPSVSEDGIISWTNDGNLPNPEPVNIMGPAGKDGVDGKDGINGTNGKDGGYYEPSVDAEGNLSWTASKEDMPAVDTVNIKGPKGDNGTNGIDGQPGQDGENGATFTPTVDSSGNLSWSNDKSLPNPDTVNIKGPQGEKGADGEGLPAVTTTDNGKFARVVDGVWSAVALTNAEEVSY